MLASSSFNCCSVMLLLKSSEACTQLTLQGLGVWQPVFFSCSSLNIRPSTPGDIEASAFAELTPTKFNLRDFTPCVWNSKQRAGMQQLYNANWWLLPNVAQKMVFQGLKSAMVVLTKDRRIQFDLWEKSRKANQRRHQAIGWGATPQITRARDDTPIRFAFTNGPSSMKKTTLPTVQRPSLVFRTTTTLQ